MAYVSKDQNKTKHFKESLKLLGKNIREYLYDLGARKTQKIEVIMGKIDKCDYQKI